MARYVASIDATLEPADAFSYLGNFANTQEWDPGVRSATRTDGGALGAGSTFRVEVSFMGRTMPLEYRIIDWSPPRRVVLTTETDRFAGRDEIAVEPAAAGSRITYTADIRLKGLLKIAEPIMALAFRRTGDKAVAGLRHTLAQRAQRRAS